MLCKFARTCVGFVSRLERSTRPKYTKNKQSINHHRKNELKQDKRDHLIRTEGSFRQNEEMMATVIDIEKLSRYVRGVKFVTASDKNFTFRAGQWVDMIIPGVATIGGFSVCSAPHIFMNNGQIELAIKYSDHPPAKWIHEQCHIGSTVTIKFGGDFFYEPSTQEADNVLLIAGGVGINPICSILQERSIASRELSSANTVSTRLLYSAKSEEELIFKETIESVCDATENMTANFFLSNNASPVENGDEKNILRGRIGLKNIQDSLNCFNRPPICFICGPPNFIDSMAGFLTVLGVQSDLIKYEKWW